MSKRGKKKGTPKTTSVRQWPTRTVSNTMTRSRKWKEDDENWEPTRKAEEGKQKKKTKQNNNNNNNNTRSNVNNNKEENNWPHGNEKEKEENKIERERERERETAKGPPVVELLKRLFWIGWQERRRPLFHRPRRYEDFAESPMPVTSSFSLFHRPGIEKQQQQQLQQQQRE